MNVFFLFMMFPQEDIVICVIWKISLYIFSKKNLLTCIISKIPNHNYLFKDIHNQQSMNYQFLSIYKNFTISTTHLQT